MVAGHAWKDAEDGGRENDRGGTVVDLFFFQGPGLFHLQLSLSPVPSRDMVATAASGLVALGPPDMDGGTFSGSGSPVGGHDLDPTVLGTVVHWGKGSVFHGKGEEKAGTPWVRPGNLTFTPEGCPARGPPLSFPLSPGAFSQGDRCHGQGIGR